MIGVPVAAVYDCNGLLQAVLSGEEPAFRCLTLVEQGLVELLISEATFAEALDVPN